MGARRLGLPRDRRPQLRRHLLQQLLQERHAADRAQRRAGRRSVPAGGQARPATSSRPTSKLHAHRRPRPVDSSSKSSHSAATACSTASTTSASRSSTKTRSPPTNRPTASPAEFDELTQRRNEQAIHVAHLRSRVCVAAAHCLACSIRCRAAPPMTCRSNTVAHRRLDRPAAASPFAPAARAEPLRSLRRRKRRRPDRPHSIATSRDERRRRSRASAARLGEARIAGRPARPVLPRPRIDSVVGVRGDDRTASLRLYELPAKPTLASADQPKQRSNSIERRKSGDATMSTPSLARLPTTRSPTLCRRVGADDRSAIGWKIADPRRHARRSCSRSSPTRRSSDRPRDRRQSTRRLRRRRRPDESTSAERDSRLTFYSPIDGTPVMRRRRSDFTTSSAWPTAPSRQSLRRSTSPTRRRRRRRLSASTTRATAGKPAATP